MSRQARHLSHAAAPRLVGSLLRSLLLSGGRSAPNGVERGAQVPQPRDCLERNTMPKNGKHMSLHVAADKIMATLDAEKGGRDGASLQGGESGRGLGTWLAERLGIPPKLAVA